MRIGRYEVGAFGLGTAHFAFQADLDSEESITTIRAAVDQGVRLIDTALAYARRDEPAYAETLVRRALLRSSADPEVLVATKGGHYRAGDSFPVDARPETLRAHCDASLKALGVEQIGLYQLHWVDPAAPEGKRRSADRFAARREDRPDRSVEHRRTSPSGSTRDHTYRRSPEQAAHPPTPRPSPGEGVRGTRCRPSRIYAPGWFWSCSHRRRKCVYGSGSPSGRELVTSCLGVASAAAQCHTAGRKQPPDVHDGLSPSPEALP